MLSHDWQVSLSVVRKEEWEGRRRYNPDGYLFVTRCVLPRLLELGADPETVRILNEENPRRFLEG